MNRIDVISISTAFVTADASGSRNADAQCLRLSNEDGCA